MQASVSGESAEAVIAIVPTCCLIAFCAARTVAPLAPEEEIPTRVVHAALRHEHQARSPDDLAR